MSKARRSRLRRLGHGLLGSLIAGLGTLELVADRLRPRADPPSSARRILLIRLDLLGDVVNSLPCLAALRQGFPGAHLTALALPYTAPVVEWSGLADRVISLDIHQFRRLSGWRNWPALVRTVRQLRGSRFDLCVCLHGRVPSALALLSGARWRVGYRGESYPLALNLPVEGRRYDRPRHEVELCLDLVRALGLPAVATAPTVTVSPATQASGRAALQSAGLEAGLAYVVVHPGSDNGLAKRWPAPLWANLADRVQAELGLRVVVTGAAAERPLYQALAALTRHRPVDLTGRTDLASLAGVLGGAEAVVAGDTGPLHLAAAAGAPVVGLFGPTDPANTRVFGPSGHYLQHPVPCGPCYDLRGPADCKLPDRSLICMWGIEVAQVLAAVKEAVGSRG